MGSETAKRKGVKKRQGEGNKVRIQQKEKLLMKRTKEKKNGFCTLAR
jgi:hypothetical protein